MELFLDMTLGSTRFMAAILATLVMIPTGRFIWGNTKLPNFRPYMIHGACAMAFLFVFAMLFAHYGTDVEWVNALLHFLRLPESHAFLAAGFLVLFFGTFMSTDPAGVEVGGKVAKPRGLMAVMGVIAVVISGLNDPLSLVWILAKQMPEMLLYVMGLSLLIGATVGWFWFGKMRKTSTHSVAGLLVNFVATYFLGLAPLTIGIVIGAMVAHRQVKISKMDNTQHIVSSDTWETVMLYVMSTLLVASLCYDLTWDTTGAFWGFFLRIVLVVLPLSVIGLLHAWIKKDWAYFRAWFYVGVASIPALGVPAVTAAEAYGHGEVAWANAIKSAALLCTGVGTALTMLLSKLWNYDSHQLWGNYPVDH